MKKTQKPGYLVIGSIIIGIVAILMVYFVLIASGVIQTSKNHIVITTESAEKLYDGATLTADGWSLAHGELLAGHEIKAAVLGSQTEVGDSENTISLTILDSQGADVTDRYNIEFQLGTLSVKGKHLVFNVASAEKYYDGEPLKAEDNGWELLEGELLSNHKLSAHAIGEITNIGVAEVQFIVNITDATGMDVTDAYELEIHGGTLKIAPRILSVMVPSTGILEESGGELEDVAFVSGALLTGHVPHYKPMYSNAGELSFETLFIYVLDENGNDVSEFYQIINGLSLLAGIGTGGGGGGGNGEFDIVPIYNLNADATGYVYLRMSSYGNFDGSFWMSPQIYGEKISPYLFSTAALRNAGYGETGVRITPLVSGLTYSLPYYYTTGDYDAALMNDCGSTRTSPIDVTYLANYIIFEYTSGGMPHTSAELSAQEAEYRSFVYENYLSVSEETRTVLAQLAAENGLDASNGDIIELVVEYIKGAATYNMEYAAFPAGVDGVVYFLTEGKEGVCSHFASAATLMFRTLGIPARYTTGFASAVTAGQDVEVTPMQAHAWVEVYIDGFGWVQLEVTPGGAGGNGNGNGGVIPPDVLVAEVHTTKKGALYMRVESLGAYDGTTWLTADATNETLKISPFTANLLGINASGKGKSYNFKIRAMIENCPYMLPYYAQTDGSPSTDCQVFGEYVLEETVVVAYTYYDYMTSGIAAVPSEFSSIMKLYEDNYLAQYLEIDDYTRQYLETKLAAVGVNESDSILDKISKVAYYMQYGAGLTYNLDCTEAPSGANRIEYFLDVSREGYCQHFATAATLLFRTMGIHARYTTGFMVEVEDVTVWQKVYGADAHAWVEVYIPGAGWIPVEVTAPDNSGGGPAYEMTVPTGSASTIYSEGIENNPLVYNYINWNNMSGWEYDPVEGKMTSKETGHWFYVSDVRVTGKQNKVGSSANSVDIAVIRDAQGNDVTGSYKIKVTGKLTVRPIVVKVITGSADLGASEEKYYNKYTVEVYDAETGAKMELLEGHEVIVEFTYDAENPLDRGRYVENTATVTIVYKDAYGNVIDVGKYYYLIEVDAGMIKN